MYFMAGMASQTDAKVVLGDSIFYDFENVVGDNAPFYQGTTKAAQTAAWNRALAYNEAGFSKINTTINSAPGAAGTFRYLLTSA